MRIGIILSVIFLSAIKINAQEFLCNDFYPNSRIDAPNDISAVSDYLSNFLGEKAQKYQLSLYAKTESPAALHFQFNQTLNNISIKNAAIKINLAKNGKIMSIYTNWFDSIPMSIDSPDEDSEKNIYAFSEKYLASKLGVFDLQKEIVYVFDENKLSLCLQLTFREKSGLNKEVLINNSGVISEKITSVFLNIDSTVTGKIFNPDPLTTAQVSYGGAFIDNNNADSPVLNNERQNKTFTADFDGSVFRLQNSHIQLHDINGNGIIAVTSTTPVFDFTRSQNGFEDVNAFYHLSLYRDYIHSLGFTSADVLAKVDPHGTNDDNSFFSSPNNIIFGTGGVDDAEDADVLIHEYSHFVSYNSAPNTNSGFERNSLDEGIADYFAASYSKRLSNYNTNWVYNWDGHNEFWNGRAVNSTKHYPEDLSPTSYYKNSELWSSTLMNIHDELGFAYTDSLVLNTLYFFTQNMTQPQAAKALLLSDTLLSNGKNFCVIYKHLYERGYVPFVQNSCGISAIHEVKNIAAELLSTPNGFVLRANNDDLHIESYQIINLNGQVCFSSPGNLFSQKENLASGIYVVSLSTNQGRKNLKWVNF